MTGMILKESSNLQRKAEMKRKSKSVLNWFLTPPTLPLLILNQAFIQKHTNTAFFTIESNKFLFMILSICLFISFFNR